MILAPINEPPEINSTVNPEPGTAQFGLYQDRNNRSDYLTNKKFYLFWLYTNNSMELNEWQDAQ